MASGRFEGWAAIRAFFAKGLAKWDDLELLPDEFWANDDGLAVHYRMSATVKDPTIYGAEHVGKKWVVEVMSSLRFEGDKVCYEADFHSPNGGETARSGAVASAARAATTSGGAPERTAERRWWA